MNEIIDNGLNPGIIFGTLFSLAISFGAFYLSHQQYKVLHLTKEYYAFLKTKNISIGREFTIDE